VSDFLYEDHAIVHSTEERNTFYPRVVSDTPFIAHVAMNGVSALANPPNLVKALDQPSIHQIEQNKHVIR